MNTRVITRLFVAGFLVVNSQAANVVINEVFYHAPENIQNLEWLEIHNPTADRVDLSGWELSRGVGFKFPPGTTLAAEGYLVVCKELKVFRKFYAVEPIGEFQRSLSDKGDRIDLKDSKGTVIDFVEYDSKDPWPQAPNGHSSSVERICPSSGGMDPNNWAGSPLPDEFKPAGTPGGRNANYSPTLPPVITEFDFSPKQPGPGQGIRVKARLENPSQATKVALRFHTLSPGKLGEETEVEMKADAMGGFVGEIPGYPGGTFLRFRVAADGSGGTRRFVPAESDLRPAVSVYISGTVPDARIPIAAVVNTDLADMRATELDRRKAIRGFGPRGREFGEYWQLRNAIKAGFNLADPWFEATVKAGTDLAASRKLFGALLTNRVAREEISYELLAMDDLKQAIAAIPERTKQFRQDIESVMGRLMTPEQLEVYRQPRPPAPGVPLWVQGMLDLKGAWFALCTQSETIPSRFQQLPKLLKDAEAKWFQLQSEWKTVKNRETFTKFRDSVATLQTEVLASLKPPLEESELQFLTRWLDGDPGVSQSEIGSASAVAPRGKSAIVFIDPDTKTPQLFDFINIKPRTEGYKVRLSGGQRYRGMNTLNLLFEYQDRFVLAEFLSYDLYHRVGNAASIADFARLTIDGHPRGYHLLFEQPNRTFLRRNRINPDGDLYKIIFHGDSVEKAHEKKNNYDRGYQDLKALINQLTLTKGDEQWRVIEKHFNVPQVINYLAINMVLSHWDGYFNNYFAYHDWKGTGKWEMYPWDQDKTWGFHDSLGEEKIFYDMPLTFGMEGDRSPTGETQWRGNTWWRPGGYFSKPLLANPEFRRRFLLRLKEILNHQYTEAETFPVIDRLADRLRPEVAVRAAALNREAAAELDRFEKNIESFKEHLRKRRDFLLSQQELQEVRSN